MRGAKARTGSSGPGQTELCQNLTYLIAGDTFTALNLAHALGQALVKIGFFVVGPGLLRLQQVESPIDKLRWLRVAARCELMLDSLFGLGIEDEAHGQSIPPPCQSAGGMGMVSRESVEVHEDPTSVQGDGPVRGFALVMGPVSGFGQTAG